MEYRGNSHIPSSFILRISELNLKIISSKSYMKMLKVHVVVNMGMSFLHVIYACAYSKIYRFGD
jgi:hypothetical protein